MNLYQVYGFLALTLVLADAFTSATLYESEIRRSLVVLTAVTALGIGKILIKIEDLEHKTTEEGGSRDE